MEYKNGKVYDGEILNGFMTGKGKEATRDEEEWAESVCMERRRRVPLLYCKSIHKITHSLSNNDILSEKNSFRLDAAFK